MIEREHARLSLTRQCRLLELSRSSVYYRPVGESAQTLALMRRIDELYLQYPFYGSRQMVRHLAREGVRVGRQPGAAADAAAGNPGDVRAVGEGVSELRIDYGPGYRVYYKRQGRAIVVLLAGGDKRTQSRDNETALRLAKNL